VAAGPPSGVVTFLFTDVEGSTRRWEAQETGNRTSESHLAAVLCRVEAKYGDPLAALDYFGLAIRNHHESGNTTGISTPLAILASFLDRFGRCESAATIAGFAFRPVTAASFPELNLAIEHLREVLGHQTYESLARTGAAMTTAEMARYAYDQIEQTRISLENATERPSDKAHNSGDRVAHDQATSL
jgi:hypothetical protein